MDTEVNNLYVHIPFCDGKCSYCSFYSVVPSPLMTANYAGLPAAEAMLRGFHSTAPRTVYFGGGTPGLLGSEGFAAITSAFASCGINLSKAEEWSVELNPSTVTDDLLRVMRYAGVNRISIGVQSFCDETLRRIGRRHTAEDAVRAVISARKAGFKDVGIDLIAGLPGVTDNEWERTLATALSLGLRHISVYSLILEEGTVLARDLETGKISLPETDAVMDTLLATEERLSAAGFERYEISNYAIPGYECRHNMAVWHGEDYLGLGPSASSRIGLLRRTNCADVRAYAEALSEKRVPPADEEVLSEEDDAVERFIFALRLNEGVSPAEFASRMKSAQKYTAKWEKTLASLVDNEITEQTGNGRWRLTRRGREVADAVTELLM